MTKAKILIKSEIIPDKIISRLERPKSFHWSERSLLD